MQRVYGRMGIRLSSKVFLAIQDVLQPAEERGYYQYAFLDKYSYFRYLKAFQEHSADSSA